MHPRSRREQEGEAMPQTSIQLFIAWAAKHKELIALQDQLAAAEREGLADAARLAENVKQVKAAAEQMLADALASFHSELQSRGITD
jgi:hypothetical protein